MRIEADLPGLGAIAITTPWRITRVNGSTVRAEPESPPQGRPGVGYRAVIATTVAASAPRPPPAPIEQEPLPPAVRFEPTMPGPTVQKWKNPPPAAIPPTPDPAVAACDRLGACPLDPRGVAPGVAYGNLDAEATIQACEAALQAQPENPRIETQLARALHKVGRDTEALVLLQHAAEAGYPMAMAYLGIMYREGFGVDQDLPRALYWLERAGSLGSIQAMMFAGYMHQAGVEGDVSPGEAARWFRMAAEHGSSDGKYELARLYDAGIGVPRDPSRAAILLLEALDIANTRDLVLEHPQRLSVATRKAIQAELRRRGLYQGAVDGIFGPRTREALGSLTR